MATANTPGRSFASYSPAGVVRSPRRSDTGAATDDNRVAAAYRTRDHSGPTPSPAGAHELVTDPSAVLPFRPISGSAADTGPMTILRENGGAGTTRTPLVIPAIPPFSCWAGLVGKMSRPGFVGGAPCGALGYRDRLRPGPHIRHHHQRRNHHRGRTHPEDLHPHRLPRLTDDQHPRVVHRTLPGGRESTRLPHPSGGSPVKGSGARGW